MKNELKHWVCGKCTQTFLDPEEKIPNNKVCSTCSSIKKVTSTGVKPAESLKDVLARDNVANTMSMAEQMEYLKMLGFPLTEIESALGVININ